MKEAGRILLDQSQLCVRGNTYWFINYRMLIRLALPLGVGSVTCALNKQLRHSAMISSNKSWARLTSGSQHTASSLASPGLGATPAELARPYMAPRGVGSEIMNSWVGC